ncbi:hypothetical protein A3B87_01215 [Candidatus Kuenenbacteria bacterium RIFCSPHIGHO2_02_FULL_39_13]|uniref:Solute-binding protein family 5 domain-containing protein n=1 Tax=Candidatus Kuenenbacteria bacterium RIFCSPHIGHO2_02_FULL_39_13 TaxID=1798561 RepID=A0A1F6FM06_9BACT|nr:MAG: hypothetical protein A3B87_01215 [Candidatus Kuenenbacteria bacterium RIFCSPHIGHO2_02_FULL_39_13]
MLKIKPLSVIKKVIEKVEKFGGKKNYGEVIQQENNGQEKDASQNLNWRQIKYISKFLTQKEKNIIRLALFFIIFSLVAMGYLFLNSNLVEKPHAGGTYTEIVVGAPQYINPLYSTASEADRDLVKLVFAGLLKYDEQQNLAPDLAQEWFQDDKGTTYTFQLRNDIYWPDEKQFTAEDVVFTIEAIKNESYGSAIRANWAGIEVKAINDFIVQFTLPEPFAPFIENATVGILPAHLWQDILPANAKLAELNIKPVGLGPYRVDTFVKDKQGIIKSYSLKRNGEYHLGAPYIEQIILKFQPTFELGVEALKNRNADGINFLPLNLKESLAPRKDLNSYSLSLPQYTAIFFNQGKNEILKNKKMRQALLLAIDKEKIVAEVLAGQAKTIEGPILPGFPGYSDNQSVGLPDIEAAKKILAEIGWGKKENSSAEINKENGQATTTEEQMINLTVANQPQSVAVGEMIQKMWQAIGVKTNLIVVEPGQIQNDVIGPRNFEALLFGEILGADPDLYPFWHSSQADNNGLNLANFKNSELDKLLETMRQEKDYDKQAETYIKFDAILKNELPAIFLYNPNYTYVVANKVRGIGLTRIVSPADRLNAVHQWYIKTRKGFSAKSPSE